MAHRKNGYLRGKMLSTFEGWVVRYASARSGRGSPRGDGWSEEGGIPQQDPSSSSFFPLSNLKALIFAMNLIHKFIPFKARKKWIFER